MTLGGCTLGLLAALIIHPSFTASAVVLPPVDNSSGLGNLGGLSSGGAAVLALGGHSSADLYVQLLQSRSIADSLIHDFDLQHIYRSKSLSATRVILASRTKILANEKSNLITIAVTDSSAKRAADLANGYIGKYQLLSERLAVSTASRKRAFFSQQLLKAKNDLADAEEQLAETQKKTGFLQPESQTQALIASASNLRASIAAKEVQIAAMHNFATAENPQMKQAETELGGLEAQLASLEHASGNPDSLIMPKSAVQSGGIEYIRRLRDVKYFETLYESLGRQLEVARLEEAQEGSGIEVVDPAIVPDRKSGPKRNLIVAGAFLLSFLGACCWVLGKLGFEDARARMRALEGTSSIVA